MLLLDEPFGALDANVRGDLRAWLRRLHEEVQVTTVLVTHDQEEAMELADRIVLLRDGKVVQVGAPRDLYDQPADEFVMGFLGPVSKVRGELVRPHDVALSHRPEDGWEEAMVQRVVHLGFEVRVEVVRSRRRGGLGPADARRGRRARARRRARSCGSRPPARASAPDPRLRVVPQPLDLRRQLARREVGERDVLDHRAHAGADRDPDVLQVLGGAGVLDVLRRLAADAGQRALDGADDVGERDVLGRLGEPVAAVGAALGADEPGVAEVGEDVLEELVGDRLGGRQRVALDRARRRRRRARRRRAGRSRLGRRCACRGQTTLPGSTPSP